MARNVTLWFRHVETGKMEKATYLAATCSKKDWEQKSWQSDAVIDSVIEQNDLSRKVLIRQMEKKGFVLATPTNKKP